MNIAISCCAFALLIGAALADDTGIGLPHRPTSILDDVTSLTQQSGRATGSKMVFQQQLDDARAAYFSSPDPTLAAKETLADLLYQRDLYYLSMYVVAGMTSAMKESVSGMDAISGGPLGGGIPPNAIDAFGRWVDAVREARGFKPRDRDVGSIPPPQYGTMPPRANCGLGGCDGDLVDPTPVQFKDTNNRLSVTRTYRRYADLRDRYEISKWKHIAVPVELPNDGSLNIVDSRSPPPLSDQKIVPFTIAALGLNNYSVASGVDFHPNPGPTRLTIYISIVNAAADADRYKTLDCQYEDSKTVYHFWSGEVPPNYAAVVDALGPRGEGSYMGTRSVNACPVNESDAKTLKRQLFQQADKPDRKAALPDPRAHEMLFHPL